MKLSQLFKIPTVISLGASFSCTEAYSLKIKNFESLLVVEATITDELKPQKVKLSKTFRLESNEHNQVSDAQVWIETSNGTTYNFEQSEAGLYTSLNAFKAQLNEKYTLNITLSDGSSYVSTDEVMPPPAEIENLNASIVNVSGQKGVQVYANSDRNVNSATYFKYDYEETYKIIVPNYSSYDVNLINVELLGGLSYDLERVPKTENVMTCYTTKNNTDIILASLKETQDNYVKQFPIRFIRSDNSILRDRYSILVTQYVQSFEAYNFYRIIKKLGTIENLFTENQPGFIQGNISSKIDVEEKVIGFFQVSSVSSKRIYFNYKDFDIQKPPYFFDCVYYDELDYNNRTDADGTRNDYRLIYNLLNGGDFKYYFGGNTLYYIVSVQCADCTSFSSTIIPEFWEE